MKIVLGARWLMELLDYNSVAIKAGVVGKKELKEEVVEKITRPIRKRVVTKDEIELVSFECQ